MKLKEMSNIELAERMGMGATEDHARIMRELLILHGYENTEDVPPDVWQALLEEADKVVERVNTPTIYTQREDDGRWRASLTLKGREFTLRLYSLEDVKLLTRLLAVALDREVRLVREIR